MEPVIPEIATGQFAERFGKYFDREVAKNAAKSLGDGAEMEFQIVAPSDPSAKPIETFTFTKEKGKNKVVAGPAQSPQVRFKMTPEAAAQILADPSEEVGAIGVNILRLMFSPNPNSRVSAGIEAGFLTLFSKGYFGVVTAGGSAFASFLSSKGLGGMGAIKAALKKLKKD